jgi:hypothetical protein
MPAVRFSGHIAGILVVEGFGSPAFSNWHASCDCDGGQQEEGMT